MVQQARKEGVSEIWGGNYGALTPSVKYLFDRVFVGYSERQVAATLGQEMPDTLEHPPALLDFYFLKRKLPGWGVLATHRGCRYKCDFCQAQALGGRVTTVPLESIDEVLRQYRRMNIRHIILLDETFGLESDYSDEVARLLWRYRMYWNPNVRLDILEKKLDKWLPLGLKGVQFGIETFDRATRDAHHIGAKARRYRDLTREIARAGLISMAFYIIGFETDTRESVLESIRELFALPIDIPIASILTPFPETPLWDRIEKEYGIWDDNPAHYDLTHLVWNHPNFDRGELENLQDKAVLKLGLVPRLWRGLQKTTHTYRRTYGPLWGMAHFFQDVL
jgi:radical SAM superfamily enzyme YgiQ (UPF0313 family)